MSDAALAVLRNIMTLEADGDGDVVLFADELRFNPWIHQIGVALGVTQPLQIEVFPMDVSGTIAETHDTVDHWDILLRPDGGDPIAEFEGLTREELEAKVKTLAEAYPMAAEDWSCEELLH